jgi:hypothetical protein
MAHARAVGAPLLRRAGGLASAAPHNRVRVRVSVVRWRRGGTVGALPRPRAMDWVRGAVEPWSDMWWLPHKVVCDPSRVRVTLKQLSWCRNVGVMFVLKS